MDCKQHITDKHVTPSKSGILKIPLSKGVATDSPYRNLPSFSTPPSRFSKILNPFESHLLDRLHLPTFSPSVFQQNSTPKSEKKFKWTIDDISILKPAEIDETTISQHVTTEDPTTEILVQQKIEKFFSEQAILPSPLNFKIPNPIIKDCDSSILSDKEPGTPVKAYMKKTCEGTTQTILALPPVLPAELEEALEPYFKYNEDESVNESCEESLLLRTFNTKSPTDEVEANNHSLPSSPVTSYGLAPIIPELKYCNLSPISKTSPKIHVTKSKACRLNFSEKMSVDASLAVPDLDNDNSYGKDLSQPDEEYDSFRMLEQDKKGDVSGNWSIEYKQMSVDSHCSGSDVNMMDISNSNTPHSKLYIGKGQRKRLSESFKEEEGDKNHITDNATFYEDALMKTRSKLFKDDQTDVGYCTQSTGDFSNGSNHVFASTPSKRQYKSQA